MQIKVGQWARFNYNGDLLIGKFIEPIHRDVTAFELIGLGLQYLKTPLCKYIKVANTPRELIQEKDLVITKSGMPIIVRENLNLTRRVVKILTPNSNGDYIKQWEAK